MSIYHTSYHYQPPTSCQCVRSRSRRRYSDSDSARSPVAHNAPLVLESLPIPTLIDIDLLINSYPSFYSLHYVRTVTWERVRVILRLLISGRGPGAQQLLQYLDKSCEKKRGNVADSSESIHLVALKDTVVRHYSAESTSLALQHTFCTCCSSIKASMSLRRSIPLPDINMLMAPHRISQGFSPRFLALTPAFARDVDYEPSTPRKF